METLFFLLGVTAIVALNTLIALLLGWVFTEVIPLHFEVKPFTCRPCLTFWFAVVLGIVLALVAVPYYPGTDQVVIYYGIIGVAVLTGLILFQYIKLKFKIYE